MKHILRSIIFSFLVPTLAFAQGTSSTIDTGLPLGTGKYLPARNSVNGAEPNKILRSTTADVTELNAPSGKTVKITIAQTPVASFDATGITFPLTGSGANLAPYTVTAATTPVVQTNMILPGYNVFPTAASNAQAILAPSTGANTTPVAGQQFQIYNSGPNTVRVKAGGGATMNGATAGGYLAVATLISATCIASSTSNYDCRLNVNPTPAGP